jgi:putative ABC transport system permease protein
MTIRTRLPYPNDTSIDKYRTVSQQAPFVRELIRRSRTIPGVREAAVGNTTAIPLDRAHKDFNLLPLVVEGRGSPADDPPLVDASIVTPEYFQLMRMALHRGRLFTDFDSATAPTVIVINEATAHAYWPNEDAIGKHVKISRSAASWATVIGVVADARTESLKDASVPAVYASVYQQAARNVPKHLAIFLRGELDTAAVAEAVREQVHAVDPTLPVFGARTLIETVAASLTERRFSIEVVALFALTALLLAALGIYGMVSYTVSARTHEIGIRLALGAQRRTILRTIVCQALALTITGAAVGVVCALIVSRLMAGVLYGVKPTDPATFGGVTALLIAVAAFASYLPARRAIRVDPLIALRFE